MRKLSKVQSFILLVSINLGFVLYFYSPVFLHPNQFLFSSGGDGISSYYNSIYHIDYDSTYLTFEGMNYPYGEHLSYSVNNPLLTSTIKGIQKFFPGISDYTVGIFNFSILISFLLASVFLFLIFEEFKIKRILSIFASFSIMVLAPQVFRLQGHLSLSYSFFIPLSFWLLVKSYKNACCYRWYFFLFLNSFLWLWVHPYYSAILATFYISFIFFFLLIDKKRDNKFIFSLLIMLASLLPILFYKIFLIFTDSHICRTTRPYGFVEFAASLNSVFVPHHGFFRKILDLCSGLSAGEWEGWAYIGLANIFLSILIVIKWFIFKRQKRKESYFKMKYDFFLPISLLASVLVLVFSMAIPFKFYPGYVPEFLNFLNEFRVSGRFSWIFYYTISIFIVCFINTYLKSENSRSRITGMVLSAFFTVIPFFEAYSVHKEVSESISKTPNLFSDINNDWKITESLKSISPESFQAILPLPFYHRGSENFSKSPTDKILLLSELLSYKSHLPLISSFLARSSIQESKNIMQILSPEEYTKPVIHDFKSKKPILILYSKESISEQEKAILQKSILLSDNMAFSLYSIQFDSLFKSTPSKMKEPTGIILKFDFEQNTTKFSYRGKGSFKGNLKDYTKIATFLPEDLKPGKAYEISFWMYNCGDNCGQDALNSMVFLDVYDMNGKSEWKSLTNPCWSEVIDGCWSKVTLKYSLAINQALPLKINLVVKGPDFRNKDFYIDELILREIPESD
ncbi:MAG: hypothetical protein U0W24_05910 [Bacteroidales bacterium]